jgi:methylglutaconyl-CoA hydratase
MAACDVVLATRSAFFQFSEVRLGLVPAMTSPFCISRLGAATARRLFLTGERIDADEALRLGLVDRVVARDALDEAVADCSAAILKGAPSALAAAKSLVAEVVRMDAAQALAHTAALTAALRTSEDAQEGLRAVLEKRRPRWDR